MCGVPGEDEYWERRREEWENPRAFRKCSAWDEDEPIYEMVICSWTVKLRRLKKNGATRWKNCTKAICLI